MNIIKGDLHQTAEHEEKAAELSKSFESYLTNEEQNQAVATQEIKYSSLNDLIAEY